MTPKTMLTAGSASMGRLRSQGRAQMPAASNHTIATVMTAVAIMYHTTSSPGVPTAGEDISSMSVAAEE